MSIIQGYYDHSVDEPEDFSCRRKMMTSVNLYNRNWFTSWVQDLKHLILDTFHYGKLFWGVQSHQLARDGPSFSTDNLQSWETCRRPGQIRMISHCLTEFSKGYLRDGCSMENQ